MNRIVLFLIPFYGGDTMDQNHQTSVSTAPLVHGGDWVGYSEEYGTQPLDFSANVSPLGVPQGIKEAITAAAEIADRYPDPLCRSLCRKLAAHEQVSESDVLCGNGAADLIFRAVLAQKPKKALLPAPTFAEYEAALTACGCQVEYYFLREENDFRLDEGFLQAIIPGIDMVFICEPNNPTGVSSPREFLLRVAEQCSRCGALFMLDECFGDFLEKPETHTLKNTLSEFPNLVILKAFTKLYAMAGVRLGYALCANGELLKKMREAGQPWAVSSLAQAAGEAALDETAYVENVRKMVMQERPWIMEQLTNLGMRVVPGEANYLLFHCPISLIQPLRQRGILLRSCSNYHGLDENWYRTAVRTHEENICLIQALNEVVR